MRGLLCVAVAGVDPLASNKGFWADVLGVGNFYFELGVQIVDVCMSTRSANGGLIDMQVRGHCCIVVGVVVFWGALMFRPGAQVWTSC